MATDRTHAPTALFYTYRAATAALSHFAYRKVAAKLAAAGVTRVRQRERLGHATLPRPEGPLIWLHGASVGECLAAMTLINRLSQLRPDARFLLTSGTATSADMAAKRLPPSAVHQFAPLDAAGPVQRFLQHWQPDAAVFVESELWPVMLHAAGKSGVPLVLANARLSKSSIRKWQKHPDTAQFVLDQFQLFWAQNIQMAQDLVAIGAQPDRVLPGGNLKSAADALPIQEDVLQAFRRDLKARPYWVASSTHKGEEETVLDAHLEVLKTRKNAMLLLAPRHPERVGEILELARARNLTTACRSKDEPLTPQTQLYLADTLGEVGTWYALSPIVFLGGSLKPIGGHNPFEVAQAGSATITGPGYTNFSETFPPMIASGAAVEVTTARDLAAQVSEWLNCPAQLTLAQNAARGFMENQSLVLDKMTDQILRLMEDGVRHG